MTMVLIGVGANLSGPGDVTPLETCRRAVARLDLLPGLRLAALSRWFTSAPVPASDQPDYVNAVALLTEKPGVAIDPIVLLSGLMMIEQEGGRTRSLPNAARTLDLDIIAIDALIRTFPDPILPHPRAHLRAFVLAPLADVAPTWVHPILGKNAAELLAGLPPQALRPL